MKGKRVMFSIVVVCLNAGERLLRTVDSILGQNYGNYEIIVKDGLSSDGSVERLPEDERILICREKDSGIYDAMNQALDRVSGEYVYFLNCGDFFIDENVLERVNSGIELYLKEVGREKKQKICSGIVFYGDIFERITAERVSSNPQIDAFACYRNVPCHQACFYGAGLMREKKFDVRYYVRADYEHFLWCFFKGNAKMVYLPLLIADYEGGGFSETKENRKKSAYEHKEITEKYMEKRQIRKYKAVMMLTLAPFRTWLAGNKATARLYNRLKKGLYRK